MKVPVLLSLLFLAMRLHAADASGAPAAVTKENDLVIVTLKPEAEQRLRLKTASVEKRTLAAVRLFSGEVVMPLASSNQPVAPVLGGTLDEVLRLADLQAAADGRILQAKVQLDAARIALERAQKVLNAEAGSVRSVDEAKSALALAEAALVTAHAQRGILGSAVGKDSGPRRLWVRVAVYSGEASLLDAASSASLHSLASPLQRHTATPIVGPATANAQTNTLDWYYEFPADLKLRAGERVAVEIPTVESKIESLVLPFNAVLHDIHGGQWVYEKMEGHRYTRRRVQVARLAGNDAVLSSGPPVGSQVVTDGAAELFGTEFMTGK
ncbi:membrane fusion protein MtrC [Prosthecobacter algae]